MVRHRLRRLLLGVSKKVAKNHLFEQPNERPVQPPVYTNAPTKSNTVQLVDSTAIEESLLEYRVVHHWATWCSSCIEEMPQLQKLQEKVGAELMLGVVWDLFQGSLPQVACQEIAEVTEAHGLNFVQKVITDGPENFFAQMDMDEQVVPQTFVFSPFGELLFHHVGAMQSQHIDEIAAIVTQ